MSDELKSHPCEGGCGKSVPGHRVHCGARKCIERLQSMAKAAAKVERNASHDNLDALARALSAPAGTMEPYPDEVTQAFINGRDLGRREAVSSWVDAARPKTLGALARISREIREWAREEAPDRADRNARMPWWPRFEALVEALERQDASTLRDALAKLDEAES